VFTAAQSGVYRTPRHVDAVRESIAPDMRWLEIDLERAHDKAELMQAFADSGFPASFGRNWDALADALSDLSWQPAEGYVLHLANAGHAARALQSDWATFIEVLRHVAEGWKARGKPFVAFVDDAAELPPWI
jgi:RNAse (barnase) inhibitor barstar